MLNEVVTAACDGGYYLLGDLKKRCCELENGKSAWLLTTCSDSTSPDTVTECLKPDMYEEKCRERGFHARIRNENMVCEESEGR